MIPHLPARFQLALEYTDLLSANPIWLGRKGLVYFTRSGHLILAHRCLPARVRYYSVSQAEPYGLRSASISVPPGRFGDVFDRYLVRVENFARRTAWSLTPITSRRTIHR